MPIAQDQFPLPASDGDKRVDDFNPGLQWHGNRSSVHNRGCGPFHGKAFYGVYISQPVQRSSQGVNHAAQKSFSHRHVQNAQRIAGHLADAEPPAPPPDSWASQADSDLAIWTLKLAPGARWTLPPAAGDRTRRQLYFFKGDALSIAGQGLTVHAAVELAAEQAVELVAGGAPCECLLLQGRPIGEPVVQYGPFVMNTQQELQQAFSDYQRTQFGGWPWPDHAPVHGAAPRRFARHADGRVETPPE